MDSINERLCNAVDFQNLNTLLVAQSVCKKVAHIRDPEAKQVEEALLNTPHFLGWLDQQTSPPKFVRMNLASSEMQSISKHFLEDELPPLTTYKELSSWLNLTPSDLAWLADAQSRQSSTSQAKLHHYHYQWFKRANKPPRLLETPKSCLKSVQRKILTGILDRVRPHEAAHGFRKGRSCITHAQNHTGQETLLCMDIENFFMSISWGRVYGLFCGLGYPKHIALMLSSLCTNTASPKLLGNTFLNLSWEQRKLIIQPHLPQGAPTSPALANLCCWKMDKRLASLAKTLNLNYSRYADDLAFSGYNTCLKNNIRIRKLIEQIAREEGFLINHTKTYSTHRSQRQSIVGIVVNEHPNIARKDYDTLKAILHNCSIYGPETQNKEKIHNFQEHLRGKIAHVTSISRLKGDKLQSIYNKIEWS